MSKYVTEWRAKELIAEVSGRVLRGMDSACDFAADQARAKAPKRTGLLKSEIDYVVQAKGLEITGYVGVKAGKAFYGYYQELGTRKLRARPFLRPAVFGNAAEITRRVAGG